MIAQQIDAMAELQSAFRLLMKNYVLAVIPLIALVVMAVLFIGVALIAGVGAAFATGGFNNNMDLSALSAALAGAALWAVVAGIVAFIISTLSQAAVADGSENVLQGRSPDLGAAIGRAFSKIGDLIIIAIILGILLALLGITVIGAIAVFYFMMFVIPAIMVGNDGALAAIKTSWQLTTKNFGAAILAFLGLIVAGICTGIINVILGIIPVLGHLAAIVVGALFSAFVGIVLVRYYDLLSGRSTPLVAVALAAPATSYSAPASSMPTPTPPPQAPPTPPAS
jgi:hypothetical protein